MTIEFALAYIPRRMQEMGYGDDYLLKFRHFVIKPLQEIKISAYSQLFLLVDQPQEIAINSHFGAYDLLETNCNEVIYEHQGLIIIKNNSTEIARIRFVQVIPSNQPNKKSHGLQLN